jgi:hypothetical protein
MSSANDRKAYGGQGFDSLDRMGNFIP